MLFPNAACMIMTMEEVGNLGYEMMTTVEDHSDEKRHCNDDALSEMKRLRRNQQNKIQLIIKNNFQLK